MADIAIVGGGAAGAAVFGELLGHPCTGALHWIVDRPWPGRGAAYSTTDDRHLLNVRANGMGLFAGQLDAFLKHVSERFPGAAETDFLPRRLFGEFIEAQLRESMDAARHRGRRFTVHVSAARSVEAHDNGYFVRLANGHALRADAVVLALGAASPRPLRAVTRRALASGAYELDPWSLPHRSRPPRRLAMIGTGLTMVDVLLSAATRWPEAELVAISRHGRIPLVHADSPPAAYPFQRELNSALQACTRVAPMLRLIRAALRESPGDDWQAVLDGMRPIDAILWQRLPLHERRRFLRHARWIWEAARHRIAPASNARLRELIESGRLRIRAARVLEVEGDGPLQLTLRDRRTQGIETLHADLVVQATGLDTVVSYADNPLLSQMLDDGLITADPLELGLAARPDGRLINAREEVQPGLYAIGSLLRGNVWECTAMPEIRNIAHELAEVLMQGSSPVPEGFPRAGLTAGTACGSPGF
ncbi:MAG TPA: FAD/NAD(P)-binding protein [Rhodanobacteraceae bacterium]